MIANIATQLSDLSRSNAINPPNTASIATSGIIELMPSAAPLLVASVESVSHALYAASFALEPKKVITQSSMITRLIATADAETVAGITALIQSSLRSANPSIDTPQRMYPRQINIFLLPSLSARAPTKTVVSVADTALAATISAMSDADAPNILYMNTLRYIFSTTHAICPTSPQSTRAIQNFGESLVLLFDLAIIHLVVFSRYYS